MKYNYHEGQVVNFGNKKVTVEELREFWGTPSYRVVWFEKNEQGEDIVARAHLKESEIS